MAILPGIRVAKFVSGSFRLAYFLSLFVTSYDRMHSIADVSYYPLIGTNWKNKSIVA